jgi:hypothetical protein
MFWTIDEEGLQGEYMAPALAKIFAHMDREETLRDL